MVIAKNSIALDTLHSSITFIREAIREYEIK